MKKYRNEIQGQLFLDWMGLFQCPACEKDEQKRGVKRRFRPWGLFGVFEKTQLRPIKRGDGRPGKLFYCPNGHLIEWDKFRDVYLIKA